MGRSFTLKLIGQEQVYLPFSKKPQQAYVWDAAQGAIVQGQVVIHSDTAVKLKSLVVIFSGESECVYRNGHSMLADGGGNMINTKNVLVDQKRVLLSPGEAHVLEPNKEHVFEFVFYLGRMLDTQLPRNVDGARAHYKITAVGQSTQLLKPNYKQEQSVLLYKVYNNIHPLRTMSMVQVIELEPWLELIAELPYKAWNINSPILLTVQFCPVAVGGSANIVEIASPIPSLLDVPSSPLATTSESKDAAVPKWRLISVTVHLKQNAKVSPTAKGHFDYHTKHNEVRDTDWPGYVGSSTPFGKTIVMPVTDEALMTTVNYAQFKVDHQVEVEIKYEVEGKIKKHELKFDVQITGPLPSEIAAPEF